MKNSLDASDLDNLVLITRREARNVSLEKKSATLIFIVKMPKIAEH